MPRASAYPNDKPKRGAPKTYVVLEGNRRLTALKALADPELRSRLKGRRWRALPDKVDLPDDLPVLVVKNRQQVAPILGFRHITGNRAVGPLSPSELHRRPSRQRGAFVCRRRALLNRSETEVKSFYRNYWIGKQAHDYFNIPDADRILDNFGVFTRVMQNPGIRSYIGAPDPAAVSSEYLDRRQQEGGPRAVDDVVIRKTRKPGDRSTARPREGQVLTDSRDVTRLGAVLSVKRGVAALRKGSDLADAEAASHDPLQQALGALRTASRALGRTLGEQDESTRKLLKRLVTALNNAITELRSVPVPGLDPPTSFETWPLVDWIEATMVLEEQSWSRTAILDSFPSGGEPDQAELDYALGEMSRRAEAAPSRYPFRVDHDSGVIDRVEEVDPRVFDFLTLLSFPKAPYRAKKQFNIINPMFDLLVREAARNYLGGGTAEAVRFGWPTRDDRPETLLEATPWLAERLGLTWYRLMD